MSTRAPIGVPRVFGDFTAFCEDETADFSSTHEQLIRQAIGYLQYEDSIVTVRDFIDRMLGELDEDMLRRLWMRTSPPIAFGGGGEPYREFLTEARNLLTDALEKGHYEQLPGGQHALTELLEPDDDEDPDK